MGIVTLIKSPYAYSLPNPGSSASTLSSNIWCFLVSQSVLSEKFLLHFVVVLAERFQLHTLQFVVKFCPFWGLLCPVCSSFSFKLWACALISAEKNVSGRNWTTFWEVVGSNPGTAKIFFTVDGSSPVRAKIFFGSWEWGEKLFYLCNPKINLKQSYSTPPMRSQIDQCFRFTISFTKLSVPESTKFSRDPTTIYTLYSSKSDLLFFYVITLLVPAPWRPKIFGYQWKGQHFFLLTAPTNWFMWIFWRSLLKTPHHIGYLDLCCQEFLRRSRIETTRGDLGRKNLSWTYILGSCWFNYGIVLQLSCWFKSATSTQFNFWQTCKIAPSKIFLMRKNSTGFHDLPGQLKIKKKIWRFRELNQQPPKCRFNVCQISTCRLFIFCAFYFYEKNWLICSGNHQQNWRKANLSGCDKKKTVLVSEIERRMWGVAVSNPGTANFGLKLTTERKKIPDVEPETFQNGCGIKSLWLFIVGSSRWWKRSICVEDTYLHFLPRIAPHPIITTPTMHR